VEEGPEQLLIPTCIGCGAMARYGTCERGCREQKLELVRAASRDELAELAAEATIRTEAFRSIIDALANDPPAEEPTCRHAYDQLRDEARTALKRWRPLTTELDLEQPAEPATTWWCPECDAIDAPQPCLGICLWRPTEWVRRDIYERERQQALDAVEVLQRCRNTLRRLALINPRPGRCAETWRAVLRGQ
jgi:hypothetical protein